MRIGPHQSMLSLAQSQTSHTMLKAVALMSSAAQQVSARVKALISRLFSITSIPQTGHWAVTSNSMQSFAGEKTLLVRLWMQRLTLSQPTKFLVGIRTAWLQQHLSVRGKERYCTHIASTPKQRPGRKDSAFKFLDPYNVLIGLRLFAGYLKACAHSALLTTEDFTASWKQGGQSTTYHLVPLFLMMSKKFSWRCRRELLKCFRSVTYSV